MAQIDPHPSSDQIRVLWRVGKWYGQLRGYLAGKLPAFADIGAGLGATSAMLRLAYCDDNVQPNGSFQH